VLASESRDHSNIELGQSEGLPGGGVVNDLAEDLVYVWTIQRALLQTHTTLHTNMCGL
jgi:hypothetical protein